MSKYREDDAGQVPLSGKGGTCGEKSRIQPVVASGYGGIPTNS